MLARSRNFLDLYAFQRAPGTTIAGVLTRSLTRSAPVDLCRKNLKAGKARAILVNSGNANAFTGKAGIASVDRCSKALVAALKCKPNELFLASTGVIGEPLPDDKITANLPALIKDLKADVWAAGAAAIMTTDTFPKLATRPMSRSAGEICAAGMRIFSRYSARKKRSMSGGFAGQ